MVIGENVAVAVHHDAGTEAATAPVFLGFAELLTTAPALAAKEALEQIGHAVAVLVVILLRRLRRLAPTVVITGLVDFGDVFSRDVDDRRGQNFRQF